MVAVYLLDLWVIREVKIIEFKQPAYCIGWVTLTVKLCITYGSWKWRGRCDSIQVVICPVVYLVTRLNGFEMAPFYALIHFPD